MSNKSKATFKEKLCHSLDIQPDIFPNQTYVELRGRGSLTLKGCGRILVYTDKEIRLKCKEGVLCVFGERLCCTAYHPRSAVVDGRIRSVCFEEEDI